MKRKFMTFLDEAIQSKRGISIEIVFPTNKTPEKITHLKHNIKSKKAYYEKEFNHQLVSETNPGTRIVGWEFWG